MDIRKALAAIAVMAALCCQATTDVYDIRLSLHVPQVVDNMQSRGKRVYKRQVLKGTMKVTYSEYGIPEVEITSLVNRNFKVQGQYVTYKVSTEYAAWNLIGNNATGVFKKPSVCASIEAQPSYVFSYEPTEDNSLILTLSGKGSSRKSLYGYAAGTLGCGCTDYGHISPTRVMGANGPLGVVQDVAAVYGTWRAKLKYRTK